MLIQTFREYDKENKIYRTIIQVDDDKANGRQIQIAEPYDKQTLAAALRNLAVSVDEMPK